MIIPPITMVTYHLGHTFICFLLMLHSPNLGYVGLLRYLGFGLINAPKSPQLIIQENHVPTLMTFFSLGRSNSLKQGTSLTRGAHALYLSVFGSFGPFIASQSHSHSPMHSTTPSIPSFMYKRKYEKEEERRVVQMLDIMHSYIIVRLPTP